MPGQGVRLSKKEKTKQKVPSDDEDTVSCLVCSKGFATEVALRNHAMMEHFEKFRSGQTSDWRSPKINRNLKSLASKMKFKKEDLIKIKNNTKFIMSSMVPGDLTALASEDVGYIIMKATDDTFQTPIKRRKKGVKQKTPIEKQSKKKKPETAIEGPFECKFDSSCQKVFISCCEYSKHCREEHKRRKTKHVSKHTLISEDRSCLICGVEAPSTLGTHLQEQDSEFMSPEDDEPSSFTLVRFACSMCDLDFVNRSKLRSHVTRIHLGKEFDKNIVCEVCGKKCSSTSALKQHQKAHSSVRPHVCEHCPKRFSGTTQLKEHSRTHSGERPYCCSACGKQFKHGSALSRHSRVHTGARPYDCQFCSKTHKNPNSLKYHLETVHLNMK